MNEISPSIDEAPLSENQEVIAEYFASEAYARTKSPQKRVGLPPKRRRWPDRTLSPATSFSMGLVGLSVMLFIFGAVAPMMLGQLDSAIKASDDYLVFAILDQTIIYPSVIVFTFATVTPMFWYGPVLARFGLAAIVVTPGCFGFLSQSARLDPSNGIWFVFPAVAYATFLTIGAVAVMVQLWSRWTLSHSRQIDSPVAPTGTRSIMELTVITAVACFVFVSIDTSDYVEMMLLFMALGICSSVSALCMLIAFLRPERRNLFAASISALFAFGGSFIHSGMHAFRAFGWDDLPSMLLQIVAASIYGAVVFGGVMWLCIYWLRVCGWACVNREDVKQAREAASLDPWHRWFGL